MMMLICINHPFLLKRFRECIRYFLFCLYLIYRVYKYNHLYFRDRETETLNCAMTSKSQETRIRIPNFRNRIYVRNRFSKKTHFCYCSFVLISLFTFWPHFNMLENVSTFIATNDIQ